MKETIISILRDKKNMLYLQEMGIQHLYLFGSIQNGNFSKHSDIDLLYEQNKEIGWEFFDIKTFLEKKTKRKVDLVSKEYLNARIKKSVLSSCLKIY